MPPPELATSGSDLGARGARPAAWTLPAPDLETLQNGYLRTPEERAAPSRFVRHAHEFTQTAQSASAPAPPWPPDPEFEPAPRVPPIKLPERVATPKGTPKGTPVLRRPARAASGRATPVLIDAFFLPAFVDFFRLSGLKSSGSP